MTKRLHDLYADAEAMTPQRRRNLLLKFERKRARIYRNCRRNAIAQYSETCPQIFDEQAAAEHVDVLALNYALKHYTPKTDFGDWPVWIIPPRRREDSRA